MRRHLIQLAFVSTLGLLSACGGGGATPAASPPATPAASPPATPAASPPATPQQSTSAQVSSLEASGSLPNLDRTSSLTGTDANADGVRDDIAQWIQQRPATPEQKNALTALARANQSALTVDVANDLSLRAVAAQQHAAVKCVVRRGANQLAGTKTVSTLRDYTANTAQRAQAYRNYAAALDGAVLKSPEGDGCVN